MATKPTSSLIALQAGTLTKDHLSTCLFVNQAQRFDKVAAAPWGKSSVEVGVS